MRALLVAVGSQGDVRPLVALAARLRGAGHGAVLAAPPLYRPLAIAAGVPYAPLDLDLTSVAAALTGDRLPGPGHFVRFAAAMGRLAAGALPDVWAAAADSRADVVVHHPVLPLAHHVAERLDIPAVLAPPLPALVPTRAFPAPVWSAAGPWPASGAVMPSSPSGRMLRGRVNLSSYALSRLVAGLGCRREVDRWRREVLGLGRRRGRHDPLHDAGGTPVPVMHAFSRHVLPPPADWPPTAHVTGYWFLPAPAWWRPPRRLAEFLDAGEPPVYIGFGSMPVDGGAGGGARGRIAAIVETVLDRLGVRAVIASGYQGLRGLTPSERVLVIRHAPHDWLFPRVAAVVHHGGAGTTGAAARAGRPQVVCPVGIDQPFWAARMRELGVAAPAAPLYALTAPVLENALRRALDDRELHARAAELGRGIRAEDGTGRAVTILERVVSDAFGTDRLGSGPPVPDPGVPGQVPPAQRVADPGPRAPDPQRDHPARDHPDPLPAGAGPPVPDQSPPPPSSPLPPGGTTPTPSSNRMPARGRGRSRCG